MERVVAAAKEERVQICRPTGCVDGCDGDLPLFGSPLVVTEAQVVELANKTAAALESALRV